MELFFIINMT